MTKRVFEYLEVPICQMGEYLLRCRIQSLKKMISFLCISAAAWNCAGGMREFCDLSIL
jgi:hypothetical protein